MEKIEEKKNTKMKYIYAKGGRKTAVGQCRLFLKGKGDIMVNDKKYNQYFPTLDLQQMILSPLNLTGHLKGLDISLKVHGGGINGQAEACRHAVSRALEVMDPELRKALKAAGYLKRDPRIKERKKPGLKRARRAPQWSKR